MVIADHELVCSNYTGNGTMGTLALRTGRGVLVAATMTVTVSFALRPPSPRNVNGLCSGHGVCDPKAGGCVGYSEPVRGYWSEPACDACSARAAVIAGCVGGCPVDAEGHLCSMKGTTCVSGYGGAACDITI